MGGAIAWLSLAAAALAARAAAELPPLPCAAGSTSPAAALPRGVASVVSEFGADPSGKADSTAALQRAFTAARTDNITLFVPLGCYRLTDTVTATQPRNGRWQPIVVVGERPAEAGGRPPAFFLPPRTPGFASPRVSKPLLFFITNWCLEPGAALATAALGCNSSAQPLHDWHSSAYQFNMALQGLDVILGEGNPSAVGVDMNAAQGSTIEDVSVYAAPDAQAGVAGGNGGGGSFKGVTVHGAKYGIDMRETGSSATYVSTHTSPSLSSLCLFLSFSLSLSLSLSLSSLSVSTASGAGRACRQFCRVAPLSNLSLTCVIPLWGGSR
jgi:hypothetical protein